METIKKGSKCAAVKILQSALHLSQDGIFGSITEEAVRDFQRNNGLKDDGIVGETTWKKILDTKGNIQTVLKTSKRKITEIFIHNKPPYLKYLSKRPLNAFPCLASSLAISCTV